MNRNLCSLVFVLALGSPLAGPSMSAALPRDPGQPQGLLDVPTLVEALEASDTRARLNAAGALGFLGHRIADEATARSVVQALTKLFREEDEELRRTVTGALRQVIGGMEIGAAHEAAVRAVVQALKSRVPEVRRHVAELLGNLAAYRSMPGRSIEGTALETIVSDLIKAMRDEDVEVRQSAIRALGHVASARLPSVDRERLEEATRLLRERLKDENLQIRVAAAEAVLFVSFRNKNEAEIRLATRILIETLEGGKDPVARRKAAEFLGLMGYRGEDTNIEQSMTRALTRALKDNDIHVRVHAAAAVGSRSKWIEEETVRAALQTLIEARANADSDLRKSILDSVASIALRNRETLAPEMTKTIIEFVTESVRAGDRAIRIHAAGTLGNLATKLNDSEALAVSRSLLMRALGGRRPDSRYLAAQALTRMSFRESDAGLPGIDMERLFATLRDEDAGVRRLAATLLGRWVSSVDDEQIGQSFLSGLARALEDPYSQVRHSAASALIRAALQGSNEALAQLALQHLSEAARHKVADVRVCALLALKALQYNGRRNNKLGLMVPSVISALEDDDPAVRLAAASAVETLAGRVRTERAWKPAVPLLVAGLDAESAALRGHSATALATLARTIKDPSVLETVWGPLIKALKDEDSRVASAAMTGLQQIVSKIADEKKAADALGIFKEMLRSEDPGVSLAAARGLAGVTNSSPSPAARQLAFQHLLDALKDADAELRARAAAALSTSSWSSRGDVGSKWIEQHVLPGLIEALKDENADVRRAAVLSLSRSIGSVRNEKILTSVVPLLLAHLNDEDADARNRAAWALSRIASRLQDGAVSKLLIQGFLKALKHEDRKVRQAATSGLGNLASSQLTPETLKPLIPPLLGQLEDDDPRVRSLAATALGGRENFTSSGLLLKLDDDQLIKQAVAALKELLMDHAGDVRARSAEALVRLAPRAGDPDIIQLAIESLQSVPGPQVATGLFSLAVGGTDEGVQKAAGQALADLLERGNADARRVMIERLGMSSPPRSQGSGAWSVIIFAMIKALNDEDARVRQSTARTLRRMVMDIQDQEVLKSLLEALVERLKGDDAELRRMAADVLERLAFSLHDEASWKLAMPTMIEALKDDDAQVRRKIAGVWGSIASRVTGEATQPAVQALTEAMQSEDTELASKAAVALGAIHRREMQNDLAIEAYEKAVELETEGGEVESGVYGTASLLGDLYLTVGRHEDAIRLYKKALEGNPDTQLEQKLAEAYVKAGRTEEAEKLYEGTNDPDKLFGQMRIYLSEGPLEKLLEIGKRILSSPQAQWWQRQNAINLLISRYSSEKRLDELAKLLEERRAKNPEAFEYYRGLGKIYRRQQNRSKAIEMYEKVAELKPDDRTVWRTLGDIYRQQGDYEKAIGSYERAIRLQPTLTYFYPRLAEAYASGGRIDEIPRLAESLKPHLGERGSNYGRLGDVYLAGLLYDEAIAAYKKAMELEPRNERYFKQKLLQVYEQAGRSDEAAELRKSLPQPVRRTPPPTPSTREEFLTQIKLRPRDHRLHEQFGALLIREKDYEKAFPELFEAFKLSPSCTVTRNLIKDLVNALLHDPASRAPERALGYARLLVEETDGKDQNLLSLLSQAEPHAAFAAGRRTEAISAIEETLRREASEALRRQLDDYRAAVLPDLLTYASIDAAIDALGILVPRGAFWRYFPGIREPSRGLEWTEEDFDDSAWKEGGSGFGYGDNDDRTRLDDMRGSYSTLYIRRFFELEALTSNQKLQLLVWADDGFVAYLNAVEIGRANAGSAGTRLPHDALSIGDALEPLVVHELPLPPDLLRPGRNVLALQGLNTSRAGSSDFSLIPVLRAEHEFDLQRDRARFAEFQKAARGEDAPRRLAYLEGRLLQHAGKYRQAAEKFREIRQEDGSRPEPLERLVETYEMWGNAYKKSGDDTNASAAYTQWFNLQKEELDASQDAKLLASLARTCLDKDIQLETALSYAQKAVALESQNQSFIETLAYAYLKVGERERAKYELKQGAPMSLSKESWKTLIEASQTGVNDQALAAFWRDVKNDLPDQTRVQMNMALAEFYAEQNKFKEAERELAKMGFLKENDWWLVGPFPNRRDGAFATPYPPEQEYLAGNFPPSKQEASYQGMTGLVKWERRFDGTVDGKVDLEKLFTPNQWAIAYAYTSIRSSSEREVELRSGSDDHLKVWLNGEEVLSKNVGRTARVDTDVVKAKLKAGENHILLKVCNRSDAWAFYFRISGSKPAPSVAFRSLDGQEGKLADFKGKVVILNFWATWHPASMREMAALEELYNAHRDGLVVLGISVDSDEEAVRAYVEKRGITYPIFMSTPALMDAFEMALDEKILTIPTTIVLNRRGIIKGKRDGVQSKEALRTVYELAVALWR